MSFIRCDRGSIPTDHHTLAWRWAREPLPHSAYQVSDLDATAAGGEFLNDSSYFRSWGIGRHIQGSQLFDYWRDRRASSPDTTPPTATCSTTPSKPAGHPFTASRSGAVGPPPPRTSSEQTPKRSPAKPFR